MPNFVQEYRSTDQTSWPTLTGQAGSLIALLDAVLCNGGTTQSVTSLVESGAVITATIGADLTLETGDYLVMAGASPSGANGTFQITVTNSTHFTYVGPGGLGTITGTITYKRAPLGWSKPYTGTNLAAFLNQSGITGRPQCYLRIDETGGLVSGQKECSTRGYMAMSDVNTGTDPFPTAGQMANGMYWRKSNTADATARSWLIYGDGSFFYFIPNSEASGTVGRCIHGFGSFISFKAADGYNCFISSNGTVNSGGSNASTPNTAGGGVGCIGFIGTTFSSGNPHYVARSYSQTGGAVNPGIINPCLGSAAYLGIVTPSRPIIYPNGADGGFWCTPLLLTDSTSNGIIRGRLPGIYDHMHSTIPWTEFDKMTNVAGLPGSTLIAIAITCSNSGGVPGVAFFDRVGPWV